MMPLSHVHVIDASRVLAGPLCAQTLGQLGAKVIKLEHPTKGDETRTWGPPFLENGLSAYFVSCNKNKKSFPCDLKNPKDYARFVTRLKKSHVFIANFLPEDAQKLKVDYATLKRINPRIIYCNISGFGADSSLRHVPGYDFAIQALSGLMATTGPIDGPPSKVSVAITDVQTALYATISILAALQHPKTSCFIDMALLDCAIASQVNLVQAFLSSQKVPQRQGNAHLQIVPYQLFSAKDQDFILAVGNDQQFLKLCTILDCPQLSRRFPTNQDRVQHRAEVVDSIQTKLRTRTFATWSKLLAKAAIPHACVQDYKQLASMPLAKERGWFVTSTEGTHLLNHPFKIKGRKLPRTTVDPSLQPRIEKKTKTPKKPKSQPLLRRSSPS